MKTVETVDNVIRGQRVRALTRTCPHKEGALVEWIRNDGETAPILLVENIIGTAILSLTNQTIRVSCFACFEEIRKRATKCSPGNWIQRPLPWD